MSKKILIIDDNPDFVQAVSALLEANQFEVVTASGGEEGLAKAREEKPDLITLDIMMTHCSEGLDVSKKLKQDENLKDIPVVLVSGIQKNDGLTINYETGQKVVDVKFTFEKPIDPEVFVKKIKEILSE